MAIKLILFDLWRTLAYRDCEYSTMSKMLKKTGLTMPKKIFSEIFEKSIQKRKWGSEEKAYKEFCKHIGIKPSKKNVEDLIRIRDFAEEKVKLYDFVIPLLKNLRKKGYKIGILSDSTMFSIQYIKKKTHLLENIDFPFFSFETGMTKPDRRDYMEVIKKTGFKPNEILMIGDNWIDDVITPKELGMNAVHFENHEKLKRDLEDFGISID